MENAGNKEEAGSLPAAQAAPVRRLVLLGLLLAASLQYVYFSTSLEILKLPSLVVFVPVD